MAVEEVKAESLKLKAGNVMEKGVGYKVSRFDKAHRDGSAAFASLP